jgi:predicted  nucleic acid-binding Zn-ribbon protein
VSKNLPKNNNNDEISGREYELLLRHIVSIEHDNRKHGEEINAMKNEILEIAGLIKVQQAQLGKQQDQIGKQQDQIGKQQDQIGKQQEILVSAIEAVKISMDDLIALKRDCTKTQDSLTDKGIL